MREDGKIDDLAFPTGDYGAIKEFCGAAKAETAGGLILKSIYGTRHEPP